MKKNMKMMLAMMAGVVALTACSDDMLNANGNPSTGSGQAVYTFTAQTESDGATSRATIDGMDIKWQADDAISIFDGTNDSKYTLASGDGTNSATFDLAEGETAVSGGSYYALYPYTQGASSSIENRVPTEEEAAAAAGSSGILSECQMQYGMAIQHGESAEEAATEIRGFLTDDCSISSANQDIIIAYLQDETIDFPVTIPGAELDGSTIKGAVLPAVQTVASDQSVDPKAVLMVAQSTDAANLQFKNVCSFVKVTATAACKKIEVKSHGVVNLAGKVDIAVSDAPTATVTEDGSTSVVLRAAEGDLAAGTYYIAVLPGTLSSGLEVRFYSGEDTYKYNTISTAFTFARNMVYNGGSEGTNTGARWTVISGDNVALYSLAKDYSTFADITSVAIEANVSGTMPAGAIALNSDNTVWMEKTSTSYTIKTTASKILMPTAKYMFYYLTGLSEITGLDKLDVSEASSFMNVFFNAKSITAIDLSSWDMPAGFETNNMFANCYKLQSLTLNNSFATGGTKATMFYDTGRDLPEGTKCTVYGMTDDAAKTALKTGTYWNDEKMEFAADLSKALTFTFPSADCWSKENNIWVNGKAYKYYSGAGTTTGTFLPLGEEAVADASGKYCAIYPAKYATSDGKITIPDNFSGKLTDIPLYVESSSKDITLKHIFGVLKYTASGTGYTGDLGLDFQLFQSLDDNYDYICGKLHGTFDPKQSLYQSTDTDYKLSFDSWNAANNLYIPVAPGKYCTIQMDGCPGNSNWRYSANLSEDITVEAGQTYTYQMGIKPNEGD